MLSNELRIGNAVNEDGRLVIIHDGFGIDHAKNFKPIPLTEEWLIKLGFSNSLGDGWFAFGTFNDIHINPKLKIFTLGQDEEYRGKIEFVNQAQNLIFSLTEKELTIKKDEQ